MQNPQRMMRALEVMEATGQSILAISEKEKRKKGISILLRLGWNYPRKNCRQLSMQELIK